MAGLEPSIPDLDQELQGLLRQIPQGRVTTYSDLAEALGSRAATRWVGEFLLDPQQAADCPVHRVVRQDGHLGLYRTRNTADKQRLLQQESIPVHQNRVDLERYRFNTFATDKPLESLAAFQEQLPRQVRFEPFSQTPEFVAGLDLSYVPGDQKRAVAAYALIEVRTGQLVWSHTFERRVIFPYIPGFLAFRELPVLSALLEDVRDRRKLADVIFVDGNGILHPRRAGIATHLGLIWNRPTLGVSKKLLCGHLEEEALSARDPGRIIHRGTLVGMALKARPRYRPIFVSPGHGMTAADAARLAGDLLRSHRVPEPIYWADSLSRRAAREA